MSFQISVIIPSYNLGRSLLDAIYSALQQTLKPFEIIVVDDGSTDDTVKLVRSNFPFVRLITQANAGVSAACNTGIRASRGKWIAFLDGDDIWLPEKLQKQANQIARNDQLKWSICRLMVHDHNTHTLYPRQLTPYGEKFINNHPDSIPYLKLINHGIGWTRSSLLVKKSVFKVSGLFSQGVTSGEDLDMALRIAYHYPEVGFVLDPLVQYSMFRTGSLSERNLKQRISMLRIIYNRHIRLARKYHAEKDVYPLLTNLVRDQLYISLHHNYKDIQCLLQSQYGWLLPFPLRWLLLMLILLPITNMPIKRNIYKLFSR